MQQIARLTDYQIVNVLFRPEKPEVTEADNWTPFRLFWWQAKFREPGLFDAEILARWRKLPEEQRGTGTPVIDPAWHDDLKAD